MSEDSIRKLDDEGKLKRNFSRPMIKDTISLPLQGYVILRFIADNPGFWMLHCHMESHSETGMMMIIKVGESADLPPKPKDWPNYPTLSQASDIHTFNKTIFIFASFAFRFLTMIIYDDF